MRILLVIDNLGSGGAQRQIVALATGLSGRGHDVYVVNYFPQYDHFRVELESANVHVLDISKRSRWSLAPVFAIRSLCERYLFDATLSFLTTPNVYLILAGRILSRTPVVVSERYMFEGRRVTLRQRVVHSLYAFANLVTTNSEHHKEAITRVFPRLRNKVICIYNGVDTNRFVPARTPRNNELGEVTLLAVASVASKKNSASLARAIALCKDAGTVVHVRWVGRTMTSKEGKEPFDRTSALLCELGIEDQWKWLGERQDIVALMHDCDAVIHPSFYEGLPNVICEALACGKIVLASDVCDHPILLGHDERGLLFAPDQPEEISAAILRLAAMPKSERETMETLARDYGVKNLSLDNFVSSYEQCLQDIVDSGFGGER